MIASVDFLRAPKPPSLGWGLLAFGVGAFIIASVAEQRYAASKADAQRALQVAVDGDRKARQAIPVVAPSARELRLLRAEEDARAPWLATLRVIEATTTAPVYLRSLVVEPAVAAIRLEAEAPSFAEALAYAKALDEEKLVRPALLTAHEQVADPASGKSSVRFSVVAGWNSR